MSAIKGEDDSDNPATAKDGPTSALLEHHNWPLSTVAAEIIELLKAAQVDGSSFEAPDVKNDSEGDDEAGKVEETVEHRRVRRLVEMAFSEARRLRSAELTAPKQALNQCYAGVVASGELERYTFSDGEEPELKLPERSDATPSKSRSKAVREQTRTWNAYLPEGNKDFLHPKTLLVRKEAPPGPLLKQGRLFIRLPHANNFFGSDRHQRVQNRRVARAAISATARPEKAFCMELAGDRIPGSMLSVESEHFMNNDVFLDVVQATAVILEKRQLLDTKAILAMRSSFARIEDMEFEPIFTALGAMFPFLANGQELFERYQDIFKRTLVPSVTPLVWRCRICKTDGCIYHERLAKEPFQLLEDSDSGSEEEEEESSLEQSAKLKRKPPKRGCAGSRRRRKAVPRSKSGGSGICNGSARNGRESSDDVASSDTDTSSLASGASARAAEAVATDSSTNGYGKTAPKDQSAATELTAAASSRKDNRSIQFAVDGIDRQDDDEDDLGRGERVNASINAISVLKKAQSANEGTSNSVAQVQGVGKDVLYLAASNSTAVANTSAKPRMASVSKAMKSAGPKKRRRKVTSEYPFAAQRNFYVPCSHEKSVACGAGVKDCHCYARHTRCEVFCTCYPNCPNKFAGCRCTAGNCRTDKCECYAADRECDALVCGCYQRSRETGKKNCCDNCSISLRQEKKCDIKPSKLAGSGLGLFAAEPIRKDEFVGLYTGEIVTEAEGDARTASDPVSVYVFSHGIHGYGIDAKYYGNQLRFANDSKTPNLEARDVCVRGEFHVAAYARSDIKLGEELFFNYGFSEEFTKTYLWKSSRDGPGHSGGVDLVALAEAKAAGALALDGVDDGDEMAYDSDDA